MDMPKLTAGIDLSFKCLAPISIRLAPEDHFAHKPVPTVTIACPVECDVLIQIKVILKLNCS